MKHLTNLAISSSVRELHAFDPEHGQVLYSEKGDLSEVGYEQIDATIRARYGSRPDPRHGQPLISQLPDGTYVSIDRDGEVGELPLGELRAVSVAPGVEILLEIAEARGERLLPVVPKPFEVVTLVLAVLAVVGVMVLKETVPPRPVEEVFEIPDRFVRLMLKEPAPKPEPKAEPPQMEDDLLGVRVERKPEPEPEPEDSVGPLPPEQVDELSRSVEPMGGRSDQKRNGLEGVETGGGDRPREELGSVGTSHGGGRGELELIGAEGGRDERQAGVPTGLGLSGGGGPGRSRLDLGEGVGTDNDGKQAGGSRGIPGDAVVGNRGGERGGDGGRSLEATSASAGSDRDPLSFDELRRRDESLYRQLKLLAKRYAGSRGGGDFELRVGQVLVRVTDPTGSNPRFETTGLDLAGWRQLIDDLEKESRT